MTQQAHLERYGTQLEVHRVIPGSTYSIDGCQTVCISCHSRKPKLPKRPSQSLRPRLLFGERLRELRVAAGLSQKALAAAAAVPQSQVSQWEAGNSVPLATTIPALAEALGVDANALFGEVSKRAPKPKKGRPKKHPDA